MNKIFISGSMSLTKFPEDLTPGTRKLVDYAMKNQNEILVGDCYSGIDSKVLGYLNQKNYQNVKVGGINPAPRDNVANQNVNNKKWNYEQTLVDKPMPAQKRQTQKDINLADQATAGIGIVEPVHNGRISMGTIRNLVQLTKQEKPAWIFYVQKNQQDKTMLKNKNLKSLNDLDSVIESYQNPKLNAEYNRIKVEEANRTNPAANKNREKHAQKTSQNEGPDL